MTPEPEDRYEAILTQATEALRETATSSGPAATLVMRTLANLPLKADLVRPTLLKRIRTMPWKKKALLLTGAAASLAALSQVVFVGASFALEHVEEDHWFVPILHHLLMIYHHLGWN